MVNELFGQTATGFLNSALVRYWRVNSYKHGGGEKHKYGGGKIWRGSKYFKKK
jgi:hypothetical protein